MATIYIGLGGNFGERAALLVSAIDQLAGEFGPLDVSSLYETDPVGYADQPRYLNAVARATTALGPQEVLAILQQIERKLGRERSFPNAPRTIDLDLLFYDGLVLDSPDLILPHPHLHERHFVLVPLAELAPELVHPSLGLTVRHLLDGLGPSSGIRLFL